MFSIICSVTARSKQLQHEPKAAIFLYARSILNKPWSTMDIKQPTGLDAALNAALPVSYRTR